MIHQNTLEAVYPLADKMARRGMLLKAISTTPVDQLVNVGYMPTAKGLVSADGTREYGIDYRILQGSVAKDAFGVCKHDIVMDEVVEVIAKTVSNNIDLARNVVNPIVKEVAADTQEYMHAAESIKKTEISVVPQFYREIWNSPILSEMVDRYSETAPEDFVPSITIPFETDLESLIGIAKTGGTRFDAEVEEFMKTLGEARVVEIFNSIFGVNPGSRAAMFSEVVGPKRDRDVALLIHLFARNLLANVPDGVKVPLNVYRNYMATVQAISGRTVAFIMRQRESVRVRKQLVTYWPAGADRVGSSPIDIYVNGDVYVQWLKEGGTPEVVLGAFVSDQERSYTTLLENSEKYTKEWERVERVLTTNARLDRFNTAIDGMRKAVAKQINEMEDSALIVPREVLHKRLETSLSGMYGKFYEKLHEHARKVVCDTMFPHTNALQLLCAIDTVYSDYPNIEVREAALLATIEVVSSWVAKLCKVEYVSKVE